MLHVRPSAGRLGTTATDSSALEILRFLVNLVKRHPPLFITVTAGCVVLGLIYIFTTAPTYTATADMVVDIKKPPQFAQQTTTVEGPLDAAQVQTQVELIKSQNVSLAVIKKLNLTDDPEFVHPSAGIIGSAFSFVAGLVSGRAPSSEEYLQRRALAVFERYRTVARLGQTYVMEVSYRSLDPEKAARIANTIVDEYVNDQLDAKYQSTRRASLWLQDRIKELRAQTTAADQAVVNFRNKNNILTTGENRLMNEQQIGEVNTQLITAQAATAEAKARLDRIQEVMKQPIPDPSVADALKNEVIIKLRSSYLDLASQEAIWAKRYGANHMATAALRTKMLEIRRNISDEMRKIAASYESDYQIARARENSLRESLDKSVNASRTSNQAQIQLRSLQSTSASYRSMYDILLQKYMEAVQQQSFPVSEARLISPALRPGAPSQPNKLAVFASSLAAALLLSFGTAFARETMDRVFRSAGQVQEHLQVNCVSILPTISAEAVPIDTSIGGGKADPQTSLTNPIFRYVIGMPFSQFTEGLRAAKLAIDLELSNKKSKVIGITSTLPGEGKTTIAANLACLIAHGGGRVLLIDGDLRNPALTRALAPKSPGGLADVISQRRRFDEVVWKDPASGVQMLTVGGNAKLLHTNEILGSPAASALFDRLQQIYDYIIVDCAPLAPVIDTRATTGFVDRYLFVVHWGQTKIEVAQATLKEAPQVHERILGAIVNKANMSVLGRYELHRGDKYFNKYYARYGYVQ